MTSCIILLFSILESLEKESKDKDEKINKIKLVAVKAKKELDSNRKEVSPGTAQDFRILCCGKSRVSVHEKYSLCLQQAQTLREELDSIRSEKDRLSASVKEFIQGAENYKVKVTVITVFLHN